MGENPLASLVTSSLYRYIGPTAYRMAQVLREIYFYQKQDMERRIVTFLANPEALYEQSRGWINTTAKAVKPILLPVWNLGMLMVESRRPEHPLGTLFREEGVRTYLHPSPTVQKSSPVATLRKAIRNRIDAYTQRAIDSVDDLVLAFCRETNETAVMELDEALEETREAIRHNLGTKTQNVKRLATAIGKVFDDPYRAYRIAATESSRALHAGQLSAMKASRMGVRKRWRSMATGCSRCRGLDGMVLPLDEPFDVNPKGGVYAVTMYPPLHPHCYCTMEEVL